MRRKLLIVLAIIVVAIVIGAMAATHFLTTPPTPTSTPTGLPTASPYLAEFRSHPKLFLSHTKILQILFLGWLGNRLGNLTSVFEVRRYGYTVNVAIRYSLVCDPSVENLTLYCGLVWFITEGPYPVPIPTPMPQNITLRNGESVIFYNGSDEFSEDWEYALITIVCEISHFEIQFSEGGKWESEEKYYFYSVVEGLFAFLYIIKTEVETKTIQISTLHGYRFPEPREEFKIQGLMWALAYYYHTGIYREFYNHWSNLRLIVKAKNVGANYLLVRAFYNGTQDGALIGDDEEAELCLREAIATAHNYGIKIFLTPFIDSAQFWPKRRWELSKELWTNVVLKWAKFAEENEVELFAPGVEMSLIMDADEAGEWFKAILPKIREVYNGKIATAEHPYIGRWETLDRHSAFAGYDCIGMAIFPWKDYDGEIDIRSFEDYENDVRERAKIIAGLARKYKIDCKIAATLGMDFWQGSEPNATIRARGYEIALNVFKEYNFTGVFLHRWESDSDAGGKEVENMLRRRWTETEQIKHSVRSVAIACAKEFWWIRQIDSLICPVQFAIFIHNSQRTYLLFNHGRKPQSPLNRVML